MLSRFRICFLFVLLSFAIPCALFARGLPAEFQWRTTPALIAPIASDSDFYYSVKDPSVVSNGGRWHVFATVRGKKRSHQIEYLSFADWSSAGSAERHFLEVTNGYFCAPQVFYFTPHHKWYMLYQALDTNRPVALQPVFSTANNVDDWRGWSPPAFLYPQHPANIKGWIDFWIICDETRAHLFFTSNNGLMWRAETTLGQFPRGWTEPKVVLRDDIFEASHTYKVKDRQQYLTIVEAEGKGSRYYKAYIAERLDGDWKPLSTGRDKWFAMPANVTDTGAHWTDNFSHGELLRTGIDEHMEIDGAHLQFLYQGVLDRDMRGRKYGEIPWRLGILEAR